MVILNEPSSPAKKNLDHAFPPFALGLPSVFERAGFDVNKKAKSRSSSRSGSRATSLNGSRAASINGSQSTIFGSSPKLGQAQHQSLGDGRSSKHNKSGLSLALPKLRKAMSDLTVKGSSTYSDASLADSNPTIVAKGDHEHPADSHREKHSEHSSEFHPNHSHEQHQDHHPLKQQHEFQNEHQHEHQPEYGQQRNSGGHLRNLSAAPSDTGFGHPLYPEQHGSNPGSLHHTDNSDDFDMRSAKSNFNVQDEIAAGHKKQGLPLAQFSGDSDDDEDSELPEPLRAPQNPPERENGSPVPSVPPHGYHAEGYADALSPQESFHDSQPVSSSPSSIPVNPPADHAARSNVLPYPLDDEEEFASPAERHENSHQNYHTESETLPREAAYSSEPSANGSDIFNPASLTTAEREHNPMPMPHSSNIPPKLTPQNQEGSPQAAPPLGISPQSSSPRVMPPHSMSPHSMSSNGGSPQGMAPQPNLPHGLPPHAMIPQGTTPRGMVPPGMPAQGMGFRGMPPHQGGPIPAGFPGPRPPQHPGMPPQGMYPQSQGGRPGHGGVSPQQLNQDLYMNAQRRFPKQSGSPIINQTGFGSQSPAMNPNASVGPLPPHMNGIIRPAGPMNQHMMSSQMNRPPMGPNGLPLGPAQGQLMGRPPMPYPTGPPMRQPMGSPNGMPMGPMGPMIPRGPGERHPHGPNGQPLMIRATPSMGHHGGAPLMADPTTPTLSSGQFSEASANGDYYASNESSLSSQVGDNSNNHTAETSPMDTQKRAVLETSPLHINNPDLLGAQNWKTKHLSGSSSIYSSMPVENPNMRGSVACIPANPGMPSSALPGDISVGHSSEPSQNSSVSFDFNQSLVNTAPSREDMLLSDTETDRSYPVIDRGAASNDTHLEEVPTPTLPLTQFRSESPASSSTKGSKTRKQCRGCMLPISGKSIRASDKTLSGRWHRECFNCTRCSDSLAGVDKIHVLNDQPFCGRCYHIVNNSTCRSCNQGIEGSCLETRLSSDGGQPLLYHAHCLKCAQCQTILQQTYFDVGGSTYCAEHAFSSLSDVNSVHKRYTQFMMI